MSPIQKGVGAHYPPSFDPQRIFHCLIGFSSRPSIVPASSSEKPRNYGSPASAIMIGPLPGCEPALLTL
eukprot:111363-Hanusia_phi.AAC.5